MSSAISANPLVEYWTYLAVDIVIVAGRFIARWKSFGLRGMAVDDFLMVVAMLLYTAETAAAHYVGEYWLGLTNNGLTPEERAALDPESVEWHLRTEGSKTQLFGWLVYICVLWTLKFCWLFFYKRLGEGVDRMALKINFGMAFCAVTFLATFGVVLLKCQPISLNWQINPDPGNWCQPAVSKIDAYIVISMNLATDFYIMSIPVPMIWSARISPTRKFGLIGSKIPLPFELFCAGLLTAIFGILRCVYVLLDRPDSPELTGAWSCRESFVAVFISNLPVMYPIIHKFFKRISTKIYSTSQSRSRSRLDRIDFDVDPKSPGTSYKLSTLSKISRKKEKYQHPLSLPNDTYYERFGSEEDIIELDGKPKTRTSGERTTKPFPAVMVTRDFEVTDSIHQTEDDGKSGKSSSSQDMGRR